MEESESLLDWMRRRRRSPRNALQQPERADGNEEFVLSLQIHCNVPHI